MKTTKFMNNREIARLFRDVAAAYDVKGEDRFRIRAYEDAADSIERSPNEIRDLWEQKKLDEVPGIGSALSEHIDELMRTGKVGHFEHVFRHTPEGMYPLLEVSGIGPKSAYKLAKHLGLTKEETAISRFREALDDGKVANIEGFGEDSQKEFKRSLEEWSRREDRMLLPVATELAERVIAYLKRANVHGRIEPLGSLRRRTATVGDVDLAIATDDPQHAVKTFVEFSEWREVLARGPINARAIHRSGRQVDLKVEPPGRFGSLLQHFTGSKEHNVHLRELALEKGFSVSEHGITVLKGSTLRSQGRTLKEFKDEESFYRFLGLEWIPPELREDRGEIEIASKHQLPKLVVLSDMRGDFHVHSDIDVEPSHDLGLSSIAELIEEATRLQYEYIGLSDHNPSVSKHTNAQAVELMKKRNAAIDRAVSSRKRKTAVRIFKSLEIDILPDGKRAVPDDALEVLDFAIVSIHSNFRRDRKKQTDRVLRALDHPKVRIFGHPTARDLPIREGVEYDWDKIFEFCQKRDIWLEVNGNSQRLDLPDVLIQEAIRHGLHFVINTDSHHIDHMKFMRYGVDTARRGWATKRDIVNTMGYNELVKRIARR